MKREGKFGAKIVAAEVISHRFAQDDDAMEVRLDFEALDTAECDKSYLDFSTDYVTAGSNQGRKQYEVAMETLAKLGCDVSGGNFAELEKLEGREIVVFGKVNDKGYYNYYVNTERPEKKLDRAAAAAKFKALFDDPKPSADDAPKPAAKPAARRFPKEDAAPPTPPAETTPFDDQF